MDYWGWFQHDEREAEALTVVEWWEANKPAGPWLLVATTGYGPNLVWGVVVPVFVVAAGARVEEPLEVRLARAYLRHKYPPHFDPRSKP